MTEKEIREFAIEGARVQFGRCIETFPELIPEFRAALNTHQHPDPDHQEPTRRRRRMSKAERAAVSARMTAYWARKRARAAKKGR